MKNYGKKRLFEDGYIKIKTEDYETLQQQFQHQTKKIEHLQQQIDVLHNLAFGQKSEKAKYTFNPVGQLSFLMNQNRRKATRNVRKKSQ